MEKDFKKIRLGLLLAALIIGLIGCSGGSSSSNGSGNGLEKTSLKVGLPIDTSTFLPLYLADSKGFFKDEGLDVEIYGFKGDAGVAQALVGDSVDINAASLTGLVKAINSNQPFIAFWGGFNHSDFEWYSPNLTSMDQIKGAKFGVTSYGSLTDFLTRYVIKEAGFDPEKDVEILQGGGSAARIAAMESGQMDANILSTPEKFMAADLGMNLLLNEKDISPTWPQHVIYGKEEFVKNNPETIKAFLRAMVKAVEYNEEHPDESVKVLMDKLNLEEKYAKLAVEEVTLGFDKNGGTDKEGLDFFWEISVESGDTDQPWSEDKWLDRTFIDSLDEWVNE
ncbi:ABC transporter substrate-binding protein [Robertmurraya massiliosenegalensis]|uniref:ABC transporter substrate-binding protein n=1 Tax=Robertmurraya TaxID=2837507 RepID=UPI0039A49F9B